MIDKNKPIRGIPEVCYKDGGTTMLKEGNVG